MSAVAGQTFKTGNSVVSTLPVGTVLQVVGPGELQVGTAPTGAADSQEAYKPVPGDNIVIPSKNNREGVVVRVGVSLAEAVSEDEIAYISDDTNGTLVVRKIAKSAVEPLF